MGYYDGLGGASDRASAYEVARLTRTPVLLLVDASGRSFSVLAAVKGFLSFRPDSYIAGVIFNRLPAALYPALKEQTERECGIPAVGYIPTLPDFSLKSRHLGLVMPEEIPELKEKTEKLAKQLGEGLDMEAILRIATSAAPLRWEPRPVPTLESADRPRIAVAMDEAFCFYYADNLELLERMGASLSYFSPLHDRELPEGVSGLYLGGGYPELHAETLAGNVSMKDSIRQAVEAGMPCIAECGGFLYLKETIRDMEDRSWPMAGVLAGGSGNAGKLSRFGYVTMTAEKAGILGPSGTSFPAHEFHHWDSEENGTDFYAKKPTGSRGWPCGMTTESLYAGFPHLYFYSHPPIEFLRRAAEWGDGKSEAYRAE